MRKSILVVPVILVVAIAVWSPRFMGDNTKRKISIDTNSAKTASITEDVKQAVPENPSANHQTGIANKPKIEIPQVDSKRQEIIVEGTVEKVDTAERSIIFAQELDDNSKKIDPKVIVKKDALVKNAEGKISFEAINAGDYVIMVIDESGQARAVELN